jgi:hypothetical protein
MQSPNVPCLIPELHPSKIRFGMPVLAGRLNRSIARVRADRQLRAQKRYQRRRTIALRVLADPEASAAERADAHQQLAGFHGRITAIERTHGRAIEREVRREMKRGPQKHYAWRKESRTGK